MFQFFINNFEAFSNGTVTTIIICLSIWFIGIIGGIFLGYLAINYKNIKIIAEIFYWFFVSIPVIIILFWLHYPLQILLNIEIYPIVTVIITLSIINILAVYKIIIEKILIIKKNYSSLGKILGINNKDIFFQIEIPLLFRKSIDQILSFQVNILHMSLFASFIGVNDIFRVAQQLNASTHATVEIYTIIGFIFFIVSILMNFVITHLKNKFNYAYSG